VVGRGTEKESNELLGLTSWNGFDVPHAHLRKNHYC
jgi:hypothetical protein